MEASFCLRAATDAPGLLPLRRHTLSIARIPSRLNFNVPPLQGRPARTARFTTRLMNGEGALGGGAPGGGAPGGGPPGDGRDWRDIPIIEARRGHKTPMLVYRIVLEKLEKENQPEKKAWLEFLNTTFVEDVPTDKQFELLDLRHHLVVQPVLLEKLEKGKHPEKKASPELLDHAFAEVLLPKQQFQLLELLYQLVIGPDLPKEKREELLKTSEVLSTSWFSEDEKLEAGLALVQVYIDMEEFAKAKQVIDSISKCALPKDPRMPLLKAVTCIMLALERLATGRKFDKDVQDLIWCSKTAFEAFKKLEEEGFGIDPPPIDRD
ncbi:hypothetical protein Cni_G09440 [Canna indica]|uniref:Uncharacterized protein n=1 Tax=Canna indica TaxID=4628 RepID=A0AAQ3K2I3_9LILI|nr:hypothetical protein Cni_G09440 [Canna indica]